MLAWTGLRAGSTANIEPARDRRAQSGFTLLEILVAFLILALALGALLPTFSHSLEGVESSEFYVTALAEAQSRMDRVGSEIPLEEGEISGTTEAGFDWVASFHRQEPADATHLDGDEAASVELIDVQIVVSEAGGRRLTLKSLRLVVPQ